MTSLHFHQERIIKRVVRRNIVSSNASSLDFSWDKMPDIVDWIQGNFYLYDTRRKIVLYDCQARPLRLAIEQDENGRYLYNTILWSWPKKSAKSTVIAAVAHWLAMNRPNTMIALVANDYRQAASRVGFYLRESIKLAQRDPANKDDDIIHGIKIPTSEGATLRYPNGSFVEMLAVDPQGEAGGNHDMVVFSELWGWKHKGHQDMWAEMTLSPTKMGMAQRWIDTYAGFIGGSPILEPLYETGVEQGEKVWDDLEVYQNQEGKLLAVWVTRPMFPWQTKEYYSEQASSLAEPQFLRMHRNQWQSAVDSFLGDISLWDRRSAPLPPLEQYEQEIIAIDASVSGDCTAMVAVSRRDEMLFQRHLKVWEPQGKKINYQEVENYILEYCRVNNVACVVYDPYQMEYMAERLKKEGLWLYSFNQGAARLKADKSLHDRIINQKITHKGDPLLRQHILNASAKIDDQDGRLRIVKGSDNSKVDALVALSMACSIAEDLNIG